jgi:NADP-dependent 3-hydroxy acid dehydrogenase YdfG
VDSFEAADTVSDKTFDRVMAVNLTAPTRMIRAVLPIMKAKKHGCIINCGSKAGMSGASAGVAYTVVSKFFVQKLPIFHLDFVIYDSNTNSGLSSPSTDW